MGSPRRFDAALASLLAVALASSGWLAAHLVYPDLNLAYPFLGGDGREWISNALAWNGEGVRFTARPPLLPLLLAGLEQLRAMRWFPVLNQAVLVAGAVGLYLLVRRFEGRAAALAVGLMALLGSVALGLSLNVSADLLASVLLFAAAATFVLSRRRPGLYLVAGGLGGLSALAQPAAFLLPVPAAATILACRRDDLRDGRLWSGAALLVLLPLAGFAVRGVAFGRGATPARHWDLLGLTAHGLGFYAAAALSLFAVPVLALAVLGTASGLGRRGARDRTLVLSCLAATLGLFFVFFYRWEARRFLLYAYLPVLALAGRGLARLPRRAGWAAAAAALLFIAWPQPGPGPGETRFTIWLWPPWVGEWTSSRLTLARPSLAEVLEASVWRRVGEQSAERRPVETVDRRAFSGDRIAVFLARTDAAAERYPTIYGLGNALGRRVAYVPSSLYPDGWWGFRGLRFLGCRNRWALFRWTLCELPGSAIVALDRDDPRVVRLREGAVGEPPPATVVARAVARARATARWVEGPDGFLVVFAGSGAEWLRLVPFTAATSGLFVVGEAQAPEVLRVLAAGPTLAAVSVEGLRLRRTVHLGWRMVVVEPLKPPSPAP